MSRKFWTAVNSQKACNSQGPDAPLGSALTSSTFLKAAHFPASESHGLEAGGEVCRRSALEMQRTHEPTSRTKSTSRGQSNIFHSNTCSAIDLTDLCLQTPDRKKQGCLAILIYIKLKVFAFVINEAIATCLRAGPVNPISYIR